MELYNQGMMQELRLESGQTSDIECLLDCFVVRLEGASDEDVERLRRGDTLQEELHRTTSIHIRTLHPAVHRDEVEAAVRKYPGYLRLSLADPAPDRKWYRRGWITFTRETKVKEICFSLSSVRFKDVDLSPVLNKDLSQRIRVVSPLSNDKASMRNDLKFAVKLVKLLDSKWDLWTTQANEIIGEKSGNPLMQNITEFLIEEMSAEEDELLGYSDQQPDDKKVEFDGELASVLDRIILYLRMVHSVDFYNAAVYSSEDEMPNRCGIFHVREDYSDNSINEDDLGQYREDNARRVNRLINSWAVLTDEECIKLGAKNEEEAIEIFVQNNTEELGNDKFLCPLSGKKFKGAEFVRKHIFNKHAEKVDGVKKEVEFFNNYLRDPKRPSLPEQPKPAKKPPPPLADKEVKDVGSSAYERPREERSRPSVKDRLGYKSAAARGAAVADPRGIVDYSDVDFGDNMFD